MTSLPRLFSTKKTTKIDAFVIFSNEFSHLEEFFFLFTKRANITMFDLYSIVNQIFVLLS